MSETEPEEYTAPGIGLGGYLALGLVIFMGLGGAYEIWFDQAYLGGGIWLGSAILLLPPIQALLGRIGLRIPAKVSLVIFVGGFMVGLLALNQTLSTADPTQPAGRVAPSESAPPAPSPSE